MSVAGTTSCGPGGSGGESCCASLEVPGGAFFRSYANEEDGGATDESNPASVSGFRLDKYLVTVGRFRQFVNAVYLPDGGAGWLPPPGSGKHAHLNGGEGLAYAPNMEAGQEYEPGWIAADDSYVAPTDANLSCGGGGTWTNPPAGQENLPMICFDWQEAYAFCIWDGGFLPSEAEWEYAAAGGSQQRQFPWGSTPPTTVPNGYAIFGDGSGNCYYPTGTLAPCAAAGISNIAPVGTPNLGVGAWGQLDLGGDVWEWVVDWSAASYEDPCIDCAYLATATDRVIRGGDDYLGAGFLQSASRDAWVPTERSGFGVRCARSP